MTDATIKLGIDASAAKKGDAEFRRSMDDIKKSARGATTEVDKTTGSFSRMSAQISKLRPVATGLAAAFGFKDLVRAGADIQALTTRLTALTGSSKNASEAMRFLRQTANQQSIDLLDLADGYTRLLPSVQANIITMQEMRDVLRLANDNVKAFGLTSAETQGLFLGLSQTFGSGTVTMEDLRQVTDRLPGVLNKTATAAGLTVNEFKKMVAEGTLTADMLKGPLLEALRANEGAAQSLGNTFDSVVANMKNAWRDFLATLAESGILDVINKAIQTLTFSFRSLNQALLTARGAIAVITGDQEKIREIAKKIQEGNERLMQSGEALFGIEGSYKAVAAAAGKADVNLKNMAKSSKDAETAQKALKKIVEDTMTPLEEYEKTLKEIDKLRPFAKTPEEMRALQRATVKAGETFEDAVKKANELEGEAADIAKAFENAVNDMKDVSDDFFTDLFSGKLKDAGSFFDRMKDMFARMLGEMATLAIARPILLPIITSAGAALGLPTDAMSGITQGFGSGGAGGTGGIMSLVQNAGSLFGFGSGFAGGFGAVNTFGANYLGTGLPGLAGGATSLGLTSILAGGGLGSIGASLLGLGNDNALINTGAGLAGSYLASLALTPFLGPFAPIVGGFAGSALSGLFNKKPSSKYQSGTVDLFSGEITSRSGLTGNKFSQENYDAVTQFGQFAAQVAKAFTGGRGLDQSLLVGVGGRGYNLQYGEGDLQTYEADPKKFAGEIVKFIAENIDGLDGDLKTALDNISFDDLEAGLKDLDFALNFKNLSILPPKFSAAETAIQELNKAADEAARTARRLGLEESKVYEARDRQLAAYRSDFNAQVQARIQGLTDPQGAQLAQLDATYAQIRRDAIAYGANLAEVEKAYGLERLKIQEQFQREQVDAVRTSYLDIRRYRESLLVSSSLSGLSREERRKEALRQFQDVQGRYASGDATFQDVQGSVNNLLDASKDYFSFTEGYYKDQEIALDFLSSIESGAKAANDNQSELLDQSKEQTDLLKGILDGVSKQLVQASGLANDPRLLRPGETFADLAGFNQKNQLPELLVRQFKLQAGFNFNTAQGNFAEFAKGNPAALSLFNALVKAVGGVPQYANGGYVTGGVPGRDSVLGLLKPGEYVVPVGGARAAGNDNVVRAINSVVTEVSALRREVDQRQAETNEALADMSAQLGAIDNSSRRASQRRG